MGTPNNAHLLDSGRRWTDFSNGQWYYFILLYCCECYLLGGPLARHTNATVLLRLALTKAGECLDFGGLSYSAEVTVGVVNDCHLSGGHFAGHFWKEISSQSVFKFV